MSSASQPTLLSRVLLLGVAIAGGIGCAGDYVARTAGVRAAYQSQRYDDAIAGLAAEEKAAPPRDKLLVLLDKGMVFHCAGQFDQSISTLREAEKLSEQLDFTSVSEEAKQLVTDERQRAYRGEDFEKLMINVILALDYSELGRDEDALVEVRRVNQRLKLMIQEEKKPYEQLTIAHYLSGVLYEDQGNVDDAFIEYSAALKLSPDLTQLLDPLLRLGVASGRTDLVDKIRSRYPGVATKPSAPNEGQVVVVVERGLSPEKRSTRRDNGNLILVVPYYRPRFWEAGPSIITAASESVATQLATSIESVAERHLNDRIGRMTAKALLSTGVKAGLAAGVGAATHNEALGWIAFLALNAGNDADRRSWLSLPAQFQVARLRLPLGKQSLQIQGSRTQLTRLVDVRPGHITLLVVRIYD